MKRTLTGLMLLGALTVSVAHAAVPTPKSHFGFAVGDDYQLANFTQTEAYFRKMAARSDRVKYVDIGPTEEGRRQCMLVITSAANQRKLERYRSISRQLARAENLSEREVRDLVAEGKAVVWIDGGLHANETAGYMQLIQTAYLFASRNDAETRRILDNVIILLVHANPDGQELISNWYMREADPKKRSLSDVPRLYQKYIGHDNNRDFFMNNMKESVNMSRQMYIEWIPQIMYNHHQTAPPGTVIAIPPYRDPFNQVYDPLVISGLDAVGAAMYNRYNSEGKPGAVRMTGTTFSTWWNGGLRTTAYYHNIIGILTELIGSPTPMVVPVMPERLSPTMALPNPVTPRLWRFRDSMDYSISANYAVLDYAARHRDELLANMYRMGRNAIERGSGDHWTLYPKRVDAVRAAQAAQRGTAERGAPRPPQEQDRAAETVAAENQLFFDREFRQPDKRDPRGFIIPADQPDFPTAVKFVNALVISGIRVHRATTAFTVNGKHYPAGSYVVKTAQAFRAHVIDMFEPQDHPNDFRYEGGPPIPPYDSAGWTLAFEMGVKFDRVLEAFDGPFAAVPYGELQAPPGTRAASSTGTSGWLISPQQNDSFRLVNRFLDAGREVYRLPGGYDGIAGFGPGTFYVPSTPASGKPIDDDVSRFGGTAVAIASAPAGELLKIRPARIALLDVYGGSMPSGWTRWLFEQFEWPFEVIFPQQIETGTLGSKYDIVVLPAGASFQKDGTPSRQPRREIPPEYKDQTGSLTEAVSLPALKRFMEEGGRVVAFGANAALAAQLNLPVRNALTEIGANGQEQPLPREKYFIPGSILEAQLDTALPAAWGLPEKVDLYSGQDSAFVLLPDAVSRGVRPIAWYATATPLRSGWGWGQHYLRNTVAAFEAPVGKGAIHFFAPNINFRAQTHGVFKLLFNPLYVTGTD